LEFKQSRAGLQMTSSMSLRWSCSYNPIETWACCTWYRKCSSLLHTKAWLAFRVHCTVLNQ